MVTRMIDSADTVDMSPFRSLYPFPSHNVDIEGLRYHYLDEGEGEPIVMVHGNPTWSFYYRHLVEQLSPHYRTIVPDHIGCGLSEKPGLDRYDFRLASRVNDLEFLLDHLQLDGKITLVVHDWGGMIGMAYGVKHPGKIGRLVIMNTAAFLPPKGKGIPLRLWIIRNVRWFAAPAVLGLNLFTIGALYMASHKGLSRAAKSGLKAPYNSWRNRMAVLKFVQDIPLRDGDPSYALARSVDSNLHRLAGIPMMICWGKHDFVFDHTYLAEWQRRFPDAEVHPLADAGHYVLEDEPETMVALIRDFLKRHPG